MGVSAMVALKLAGLEGCSVPGSRCMVSVTSRAVSFGDHPRPMLPSSPVPSHY